MVLQLHYIIHSLNITLKNQFPVSRVLVDIYWLNNLHHSYLGFLIFKFIFKKSALETKTKTKKVKNAIHRGLSVMFP